MSWPEHMDPALQDYIRERQDTALDTYERDPNLLLEHVRQEDSFKTGGYGERQISELLQNAVDALGASGEAGTVEFRIADGALYCANEGAPFTENGLKAVTYAFLSEKRGDEIGRFGLGFKSILGITDHPQIFSKTVSFEFNGPETAELFRDHGVNAPRLPLLRVPTLVDPHDAAAADANLAELMLWATTIVKLPLARGGARLLGELQAIVGESLLFFKPLDRLRLSVQLAPGTAPSTREFRREGHPNDGTVRIIAPDESASTWMYAERQYSPSLEVAAELPETARRTSMTVSYAVERGGRVSTGQLWAWFPLIDKTTASGLFNAPWQVNDDRTSMLAGSALNREMLGVAADLFLDVVQRASSPRDPAAHLDLFPARGDEAKSNADRFLSQAIPERAAKRAMIPDFAGELKVPSYFKGVPDLQGTPLIPAAIESWQELVGRATMPHASTFTTAQRRLRLRTLLGGSDKTKSPIESGLNGWFSELVGSGEPGRVDAALRIVLTLKDAPQASKTYVEALKVPIVPINDGRFARIDDAAAVLLPIVGTPSPDGVRVVRDDVTESSGALLRAFGFRPVSGDQIALALAEDASSRWSDGEWERFWLTMREATPTAASTAIGAIRARGVAIAGRTVAGTWRPMSDLLADGSFARDVRSRQIDPSLIPNVTLRTAAGALTSGQVDRVQNDDALFSEYEKVTRQRVREQLTAQGYPPLRVDFGEVRGVGPVDILTETLTDDDRVRWTADLLRKAGAHETMIDVPLGGGKKASVPIWSFEIWAARARGLVQTTLGPRPLRESISRALARFGAFLPVIREDLGYSSPRALADVPAHLLTAFLGRQEYRVPTDESFSELVVACAARTDVAVPSLVPAIVNDFVVLTKASSVAVAVNADDIAALKEGGVAFIPVADDEQAAMLVDRWSLLRVDDALRQSVEVSGREETTPLLDVHPSLPRFVQVAVTGVRFAKVGSIQRVMHGPDGEKRKRLPHLQGDDGVVLVDAELDDFGVLMAVSRELQLGLQSADITSVFEADEALRRSERVERARLAKDDSERILLLVGVAALKAGLPRGFLEAVEARAGTLDDRAVADLYLRTHGSDAVRVVRSELQKAGIAVPIAWDGSPRAQELVKRLGFSTSFAGTREVRPPSVTQVLGKLKLTPLHGYQSKLALEITDLVREVDDFGQRSRGLLYLPTGAGKTRTTVESVVRMLVDGKLGSPVLWIAQSQELCEQAIESFREVWRWLGDEHTLDVSRFWSGYELDESESDLHVVVAIDDTLDSRLGEPEYAWLREASMVIIDEAHTAGDSPTYTRILRHLGITSSKVARPLLGLTATPFKGRNPEVNRLFAARFGDRQLTSLPEDDPIGELRRQQVLSEVDHHVLEGVSVDADAQAVRLREVSKAMLDTIGQDMERTRTVVDDIIKRVVEARGVEEFPVLVFAASVASAHTIAALLEMDGVRAKAVDGSTRTQERRRVIKEFKDGTIQVLVNCDLLTQGFDAPKVRALYIARPTFSPNRYLQMVGRGLRGPSNGGTERCLIVNVADTFQQFGDDLAYTEFDYLWSKA